MSPEQKQAIELLALLASTNRALTDLAARVLASQPQLSERDESILSCIPVEPDRVTGEALLEKVCLSLGVELSERTLTTILQRLKALGLVTSSDRKPYGYARPNV